MCVLSANEGGPASVSDADSQKFPGCDVDHRCALLVIKRPEVRLALSGMLLIC